MDSPPNSLQGCCADHYARGNLMRQDLSKSINLESRPQSERCILDRYSINKAEGTYGVTNCPYGCAGSHKQYLQNGTIHESPFKLKPCMSTDNACDARGHQTTNVLAHIRLWSSAKAFVFSHDVRTGLTCLLDTHLRQGLEPKDLMIEIEKKFCPVVFDNSAIKLAFDKWTMAENGRFHQVPATHLPPASLSVAGHQVNVTALKKILSTPDESRVSKWMLCVNTVGINETCCVTKEMQPLNNNTAVLQRAAGRVKMF